MASPLERLAPSLAAERTVITREALRDGWLVDHARTDAANAGSPVRSDDELALSMQSFLSTRSSRRELWVFGYGSLMWNPAFRYAERRVAALPGWRRSLCLWAPTARGTPERPGLFLALERGHGAQGVAFRLPPQEEADELSLIWAREMFSDAYLATWAQVDLGDRVVGAVTFVVNPDHEFYADQVPEDEIVDAVANAAGFLGSCADYLNASVVAMGELGVRDVDLERINDRVRARVGRNAGRAAAIAARDDD